MTLHFDWIHASRWFAHAHVNRAVSLVLGIIGVSLLFGALRIVDAAISGALIEHQAPAVGPASLQSPDRLIGSEPPSSGEQKQNIQINYIQHPISKKKHLECKL